MKVHTTNYTDTFIAVAEDCTASSGEVPPVKGDKKTIANIQYDLLHKNPYKYTSDDVVFLSYAQKNDLTKNELPKAREAFFSKGQPCLRASPLTKRYGWGIHSDKDGRIAMFGCETDMYEKMLADKKLKVVKAMRSAR